MSPAKLPMLQSRLQRRLRALELKSLEDYQVFLFSSPQGEAERVHFINAITTNKTDFFREAQHFDYLVQKALPALAPDGGESAMQRTWGLKVWCAGCSSGEEPYTLAMVLGEFREGRGNFDFSIFATDISTKVLAEAELGIYDEERIEPVPLALRPKYLLRSKDRTQPRVRIVPDLRRRISFQKLNFMDSHYDVNSMFNIIFFRNVMIYFDKQTQEDVIHKLCRNLAPGGYLFVGHSESLAGLQLPVVGVDPAIYRKPKLPGQLLPTTHLQPGELLVTQEPQWVTTLLGSCVAVTMHNPRFRLAAICHAMLPEPHDKHESPSLQERSFRYLSHAIPAMAAPFFQLGLKPDEVGVKMFGGGNVIGMGCEPNEDQSIGAVNIATARRLLESHRFQIKAQNVGGNHGCKIFFNTQSGEVLHKSLSKGVARP